MTSTNHHGYAVYALDRFAGWRLASKVFHTRAAAEVHMAGMPRYEVERQVREVVTHKGVVT